MQLLNRAGKTFVMVTHDPRAAERALAQRAPREGPARRGRGVNALGASRDTARVSRCASCCAARAAPRSRFFGLVISFFLYTALESVLYTLESVVERTTSETGVFMRAKGRGGFFRAALPTRYVDSVRELPGVVAASPVRFYFGLGREEGSFAVALGVDAGASCACATSRASARSRRTRSVRTATGALVGRSLLEIERLEGRRARHDPRAARACPRSRSRSAARSNPTIASAAWRSCISTISRTCSAAAGASRSSRRASRDADLAAVAARSHRRALRELHGADRDHHRDARTSRPCSRISPACSRRCARSAGSRSLVTMLVVANSVAMSIRERTVEIGTLRARRLRARARARARARRDDAAGGPRRRGRRAGCLRRCSRAACCGCRRALGFDAAQRPLGGAARGAARAAASVCWRRCSRPGAPCGVRSTRRCARSSEMAATRLALSLQLAQRAGATRRDGGDRRRCRASP